MLRIATLLSVLVLSACADEATSSEALIADDEAALFTLDLSDAETDAVIELANTASLIELDDDMRLDSRAANGIVEQRPFVTLEELDAVPYVGDSALGKLFDYAAANGLIEEGPELIHGIEIGSVDARAVLLVVNTATHAQLDDDAGLDVRAADAIVVARDLAEIATLEELDSLSYVGASAFDKLLAYSVGYEVPCPPGEIHSTDGAVFADLATAADRSSDGATLTLCPGTYAADLIQVRRPLNIVGVGDARVQVDQMYLGAETHWENLDLDGRVMKIEGTSASDRLETQMTNVQITGHTLTLIRAQLHLTDSTVDGLYRLDLNYWSNLYTTDTWFHDGGSNTSGDPKGIVHVGFASNLGVTGGGFYNNTIGVTFDGSSARFTEVDFGIGDTDNDLYDFRGAGAWLNHLHAETTMFCNNFGCQ